MNKTEVSVVLDLGTKIKDCFRKITKVDSKYLIIPKFFEQLLWNIKTLQP